MRRSQRVSRQLNYAIFHSKGKKVYKDEHVTDQPGSTSRQSDMSVGDDAKAQADAKALEVSIFSLTEDINDFIDENGIDQIQYHVADMDTAIQRMEDFRTIFRQKNREVKALVGDTEYNTIFSKLPGDPDVDGNVQETNPDVIVQKMKKYISEVKDMRKSVRNKESDAQSDKSQKDTSYFNFLKKELEEKIQVTKKEVEKVPADFEDDDLLVKKAQVPDLQKRLEMIWNKILELMKMGIDSEVVEAVKDSYSQLVESKDKYVDLLQSEVSQREVKKKENFKRSKLNIKLARFSGYNSPTDVYTFQTDFEKICLPDTPSDVLPDLLKNNYLSDPALSLVKSVDDMDEIWKRLKQAYGNSRFLLQKKLKELINVDTSTNKGKDFQKTELWMSKTITIMKDLSKLAIDHKIESLLYNGDGIDKVMKVIGEGRVTRWLSSEWSSECSVESSSDSEESIDFEEENKKSWQSLIKFLEKELKVLQRKAMVFHNPSELDRDVKAKNKHDKRDDDKQSSSRDLIHFSGNGTNDGNNTATKPCSICDSTSHEQTNGPKKSKIVQYFACPVFANMSVAERFKTLYDKGLCFQCIFPGADRKTGKHKEGKCQTEYCCKDPSHDRYTWKKHILVCDEHKENPENQKIFESYKERCITKNQNLPAFAQGIHLSYHNSGALEEASHEASSEVLDPMVDPEPEDDAVFLFQIIEIFNEATKKDEKFLIFYDLGCGKFLARYKAIQRLGSRATLHIPPPLQVMGIAGIVVESQYGSYNVKLPLANGRDAQFTGLCFDKLTEDFATYPLQGAVEDDIRTAYKISGGNVDDLPRLPKSVGGEVDFLVGIKYNRHAPREVFRTVSGLSIYESKFKNPDGSRGLIGGNHHVFTAIEQQFRSQSGFTTFLSNQIILYSSGYMVNPDVGSLGHTPFRDKSEEVYDEAHTAYKKKHPPREVKKIEEVENAGTDISFRCVKCRMCKDCTDCKQTEAKSIREEVEEDIIRNSVFVDVKNQKCVAKMPVIENPVQALAPNKHKALKVNKQQVTKTNKSAADKESVLKAERKLQDLGFVEWVTNLPEDIQEQLRNNPIQNFLAWRIVWKSSSVSSPARPVFDASMPTDTGKSLNDILVKGRNNMNKLQEVFLRWLTHKVAYHCDLQTWYNSLDLRKEDWCFQRYLWQDTLDPDKPPEEKIIKTPIYGVKPSGNLVQRGMLDTAELSKDKYPEAYEVITQDFYADDCMSGEEDTCLAYQRADEMEIVVSIGGFTCKGFTFSGQPPLEKLSDDGKSISVGGMRWFPEEDQLAFSFGDVNFTKKSRGRKPDGQSKGLPHVFTRRQAVAFVAEMFDLTGKINPFISAMKQDLNDLTKLGLSWDDAIPDNLRGLWEDHMEMREEIRNFRYNRAVVPDDAINLDITTLDFGDASTRMACVAIYVRFQRPSGYSCQLILARSRILPENTSQPRAELSAAVLNTHSGEILKKALNKHHKGHLKMCDSQIVLHWLSNPDKPLKLWPRNRVIECNRFTDVDDWRYIPTDHMLADLGTRRGVTADDIAPTSEWINGAEWMKGDPESFPVKKIGEMLLSEEELKIARSEAPSYANEINSVGNELCAVTRYVDDQTSEVYGFSKYVIDPNLRNFTTVVRILSWIIRYLRILKSRVKKADPGAQGSEAKQSDVPIAEIQPAEEDVSSAETYFFKKATAEIKKFYKGKLDKFTEKDGILLYNGRLLPDEVQVITPMADAMKDLTSTTFCVPAVYKHSPIAYALVNDVHWNNPVVKHSGNESVFRFVLKKAFIIEGRDIVKRTKKSCERCRYIAKRTIEVIMGPVSKHNLNIAPAFYSTQCDLAGPFKSYSHSNKRAEVKIWMAVFVCATTGTTNIKTMGDYTSLSFSDAFIRLSCEVGYPKVLLIDSGSQVKSSFENMTIDFQDVKSKIYRDVQVECEVVPVGGHNMNGKVERKIREIKLSIEKSVSKKKLSLLQWETLAAKIANRINDLPLAVGHVSSEVENLDLITPNRLRLGRNNERSPVGDLQVSNDAAKILEENSKIFQCWFENWLVSYVPNLIDQPKWYNTSHHIQVGDVVLFTKDDKFSPTYKFGIVCSTSPGPDGQIREVMVKYRNHDSNVDRTTNRAVRSLVVIHKVDEINIMQDLYEMDRRSAFYVAFYTGF